MFLVVMGVAGAGKSTLGAAAALALGWPFVEGDALHPPGNVAKMRVGLPLVDADRRPWLDAVGARMASLEAAGTDAVLACSTLKAAYRARLRAAARDVRFVFLRLDPGLARDRVAERAGHFMPASLIDSQFATLQPPSPEEGALMLNAAAALEDNVAEVRAFAWRP